MWDTKEDFLFHVENQWYLRQYAAIVADWAIGEEEMVLEDYLAKNERDKEGCPAEEHYVVTDRRLLHFNLTRREIDYRTVFVSDAIASISQSFPVPERSEDLSDYELMRAPNVEVTLKTGTSMTFEAPPLSEDKEPFRKFVLALTSLIAVRRV